MPPRVWKNLNLIDTGDFEHAVLSCLNIPSPDIYHFGGEVEGLHDAVAGDIAVAGGIIPEDRLPLPVPSRHQSLDIGGVVASFRIIGNAGAVVDAEKFPLEVFLEGIGDRQVLNHIVENIGLLLGEVDELGKIRKRRGHLPHLVHIAIELAHHQPRLPERVNVAVYRARRGPHLRRQILDGQGCIPREHLRQAQEFDYLGLVHVLNNSRRCQ